MTISPPMPRIAFPDLFTRLAAAAVLLVGCLVLLGWALDLPWLKSGWPGLVSVKANTALALVAAGGALWLLGPNQPAPVRRRLGQALAGLVVGIGLATSAEYILGADFGVDQMLAREAPGTVGTAQPGRMAPATALNLVLVGLALLLLDVQTLQGTCPAQFCALLAALIAGLALIGYLYGVEEFYGLASATQLAVPTILALLVLCGGILSARPECGLMALLLSPTVGGLMTRRLLPVLVILLFTLGWIHLAGHEAGLYDHRLGVALLVLSCVVVSVGFLWANARSLYGIDTRRRHAEEAVRHQREQLRITLASIGDGVIVTDTAGRIISLNPVAEFLTGWEQRQAAGRSLAQVFRVISATTGRPIIDPVARVLEEGTVVGLGDHTLLIAQDGTQRPLDDSAAPIRDEQGAVSGVVLIFRDVTEQRRAQNALQESELRFRQLAENIDNVFWMVDPHRLALLYISPAFERIWGRTCASLYRQPRSFTESVHPADRARVIDALDRQVRGETTTEEYRIIRPDGSERWIRDRGFPIKDASGQVMRVAGIAEDVTARKRAEEELAGSEERLRLALEAGRMGVWDWNLQSGALRWSDNLEPIHGLAPGTFAGTFEAFLNLIHPGDRAFVAQSITQAVESRTNFDMEFRIVWPDGSVHWMAGKGKVFQVDGRPVRMIGVGLDVTDRKRSEQAFRFLAEVSATLAELVDCESTLQKLAWLAVPYFADWCAVDLVEADGKLRRLAVAHADPARVELANDLERRYPPDPDSPHGVYEVLRTGRSELVPDIPDEWLMAGARDPEHLDLLRRLGLRSYLCVPLSNRGKVLGVVSFVAAESGRRYDAYDLAVAEDLAHRATIAIENAQLYREVRANDRRKDEFLAMLAHELRNPLAPLRNALHILRLPGVDGAVADRARDMMERQVQHIVRLVDDLLDVSRLMRGKIELRKECVELTAVVTRAVETAQPLIDAQGHQLTIDVPAEPVWLEGDLIRLTQVVSNLLNNAAKYTERGGRIWLRAGRERDELVLRVGDTGIGMPPELLPRVFDLFMQAERSIARSQGGLGIGLTLVRSLVEMHGGTISAHSAGLGQGSEFVVRLPLRPAAHGGRRSAESR